MINKELYPVAKNLMNVRGNLDADGMLSSQGQNELLEGLPNMIFKMMTIKSFLMGSEFSLLPEILGDFGMEVSEGGEFLENKLITSTKWDKNKFVPDPNSVEYPIQLRHTYGGTKYQEKFRIPINREIVARAFTSQGAFDEFMSQYMGILENSLNIWLYRTAQNEVFPNIINSEDLGTINPSQSGGLNLSEQQVLLITIQKYFYRVMKYPQYTENMDGRQRKVMLGLKYTDLLLFCSTNTKIQLTDESLSNLFNQKDLAYMDKGMFGQIVECDSMPDNCIYVIRKGGIQLLKRIQQVASQLYTENFIQMTVLMTWYLLATKPWYFGVKIFWDLKSDPTTKNGELNFKIDTSKMKVAIVNNISTVTGITIKYNLTDTADYGELGAYDYFVAQLTRAERTGDPIKTEEGMDGAYGRQYYLNSSGASGGAKNDYFAKAANGDLIDPVYAKSDSIVKGVDTVIFKGLTDSFSVTKGKYLLTVAGYLNKKRVITSQVLLDLTVPA